MATNNTVNWTLFKDQVENLLVVGYCLPLSVQISAIEHLDSRLEVWRDKVGLHSRSSISKENDNDHDDSTVSLPTNNSLLPNEHGKDQPVGVNESNIAPVRNEDCSITGISGRRRGRKRKIGKHPGQLNTDKACPNPSKVLTRSLHRRQKTTDEDVNSTTVKIGQEVECISYSLRRKRKESHPVNKIKKEIPDPGKILDVDHPEENSESPSKGNKPAAKTRKSCQTVPQNNPHASPLDSPSAESEITASKINQSVSETDVVASEINQSFSIGINDSLCETDVACEIKSVSELVPTSNDINDSLLETNPPACDIDQSSPETKPTVAGSDTCISPSKQDVKEETVDAKNSSIPKQCHLCHNTYNSNSGYVYHMKRHEKMSVPCADCTFVALTAKQLDRHIINVHCDKDEGSQTAIKRMKCRTGKKKAVVLPCGLCDKKFVSEYNLKFHLEIHKNGPLQCPDCPKLFHSKIGYDAHLRMHTGEGLSHCSICDYVTGSKGTLKKHVSQVHHRQATHLCDLCGKGFTSKQLLKRHDIAVHRRDEMKDKNACPHCDHKTHDPLILKAHIRNMHTDRESHMCNICGITLKYRHSLLLHMQRHSSNKTMGCPECSYKGICQKDVRAHIKRRHTECATVSCDICGKSFNDRGHLARHRVIHTGEKDYACQFCTYRCNVKSNLSKHMVSVHKFKEIVRYPIQKIDQEDKDPQEMSAVAEVADTAAPVSQKQYLEVAAPAVSEFEPPDHKTMVDLTPANIGSSGGLPIQVLESHSLILGLENNGRVTHPVPQVDLQSVHPARHVIVSEALDVMGNTCTQHAENTEHVPSHVTLSNAIPVLDHVNQSSGVNVNDDKLKQVYITADSSIHLLTDSNSVVYMTIDS